MTSIRADVITKRTYNRPLEYNENKFESWTETIHRVIDHQRWLWERALTSKKYPSIPLHDITEDMQEWVFLNKDQWNELLALRDLMLDRLVLPAGRSLWLGGTDISKKREASQFNCSFTVAETVYDIVDIFWLLLQGCGVGFKPVVGTLTGFKSPIPDISVIRSNRKTKGGRETNEEQIHDNKWVISIGDSAEAWAKSIGKLLAGKFDVSKLIFDFSELRPAGDRLKGYGWISSGDGPLADAYLAIAEILNKRSGNILSKIDILDIVNYLGTVLSSRRSAQIALVDYDDAEMLQFAKAKTKCYTDGFKHRQQSNNSIVFKSKPTKRELLDIFELIIKNGGSEPGLINAETAIKRAPWFMGSNPCGEILLANKSFCNLVEVNIAAFEGNIHHLLKAIYLISRANFRQTMVDFRDGILQESWHLNNEFLRLCGTSITGIAKCDDISEYDWKQFRQQATFGANSMAKELNSQIPKNVTTVKPSGTLSKIMDTWEGIHKPIGRYIFNWVNFGMHDPIVEKLKEAGFRWLQHPTQKETVLICFPIDNGKYFDTKIVERVDGTLETLEVNLESAIDQLNRYKKIQRYYCDHNVSNTIYYNIDEKDSIVDWLYDNWEEYVGVSFLFRTDPTMSAKDLGYNYLPQEVVTEEKFKEYVSELPTELNLDNTESFEEIEYDECKTGACPVK